MALAASVQCIVSIVELLSQKEARAELDDVMAILAAHLTLTDIMLRPYEVSGLTALIGAVLVLVRKAAARIYNSHMVRDVDIALAGMLLAVERMAFEPSKCEPGPISSSSSLQCRRDLLQFLGMVELPFGTLDMPQELLPHMMRLRQHART